jgi:hypothetical protein
MEINEGNVCMDSFVVNRISQRREERFEKED